ncbi:MAG TPA: hypothetical protein VKB79_11240 [Bryobacteraceae bacterium]|nr:hypothetical protein [Bryobacteraceae bacterium]
MRQLRVTNTVHRVVTLEHPSLYRCGASDLTRLQAVPDIGGLYEAVWKAEDFTGATPAFVAVTRHNAFSSLLSSLWGSPPFAAERGAYEIRRGPYMNIKPQPKVEMTTLSITGVEKRLVDGFRQRCEDMDGSAQGFIMNQILAAFLKSKARKATSKRRTAAA